jgi:AraC-like DNA-binding protein
MAVQEKKKLSGESAPAGLAGIEEGIMPDIGYLVFRKCTPVWQIKESEFPAWDITYVTAGGARYIIDGVQYDLSSGDVLCIPPGHVRSATTFPDRLMRCFAVNFKLKNMNGRAARLPFPLISHIGPREDLVHLFHELAFVWLDRQPLYTIKSQALFLLILHRLFELIIYNIDSSSGDPRIKTVVHHIASHYAEKISVKQMASVVGLNTVYFGALFKRETGMTMNRYLVRIRIKNAENLLRSGEYTVGEVAERCGYNDTFHFYKQFKNILGIPPSDCVPKKNIY